ncbi:MAG: PcfJ domain-containing protein [Verrucomicrobiae bacterium]|nr:PcfJ domain-containing protein [Verrucomicrobiae bacterium]
MDSSAPTDFVAEAARLFGGTVMDRRRFRPGISSKNGKLYVFSASRIIVMAPWPEMRAWTKTKARPQWRPCRPFIRLGFHDLGDTYVHSKTRRWDTSWPDETTREEDIPPLDGLADEELDEDTRALCEEMQRKHEKQQARERSRLREYFSAIPPKVATLVAPFPERQWHLLSFLARCPGAEDLLVSNPALAYALASNWVYRRPAVQRPLRAARSLLRHKQRHIAEWLGFVGTEAAVRVLRKVQPDACQTGLLLRLRDRMQHPPIMKFLSHCPPMDAASLLMFLRPETTDWTSPSLLEQARAVSQTLTCARHLADIVEMRRLLGDARPARRLTRITQLRALHDSLVERMKRAGLRPTGAARLPPPPFPGSEHLIPLTTEEDLLEEGYRQSNCVGAYARRVRRGCSYIYRLLAPERATVEVVLRKAGWKLGEVEAAGNQSVAPETERVIIAWLAKALKPRPGISPPDAPDGR